MRWRVDWDEDRPVPGRHRAGPSIVRKAAGGLAAGVLVAAMLGGITSVGLGLTGGAQPAPHRASTPSRVSGADPSLGRTVDLGGVPDPSTEERSAGADPGVEDTSAVSGAQAQSTGRMPAPAATPSPQPRPQPGPGPGRAQAPIVRRGAPCSVEGATAVTSKGDPAVCTATPGNRQLRWRVA